MSLSKFEKETILLTSEGDKVYDIMTYNPAMQSRLSEFSRKFPDLCRHYRTDSDGGEYYEVNKDRVSIRFLPPRSDESRKAASERAKNANSAANFKKGEPNNGT